VHERVESVLAAADGAYTVYRHADFGRPVRGPHDVAAALNIAVDQISKTLFLAERRAGERYALVCAPITANIDLAAVATLLGYGRLELGTPDALATVLGYPRHGVSPLGGPADVPVVVDERLLAFSSVLVGAGIAGVEIALAPATIVQLSRATVANVTS
jgi:Cys-tRNA(Pro)/Cys-tRNA(Cys) deacylase